MDLYWIDGPWTGKLAISPHPGRDQPLADDIRALKDAGLDVIASLLTEAESNEFGLVHERQSCERHGLRFFQFPIVDVSVPTSPEATLRFVSKLEKLLAKGENVGIHCRNGVGRSGIIAACLLILRGLSPEQALEEVSNARGVIVPQTAEQREWVVAFAKEFAPTARGV